MKIFCYLFFFHSINKNFKALNFFLSVFLLMFPLSDRVYLVFVRVSVQNFLSGNLRTKKINSKVLFLRCVLVETFLPERDRFERHTVSKKFCLSV